MDEYTKQAKDFLQATNTTIKHEFVGYKSHFDENDDKRDVYRITIKRGERQFSFDFGQSINCSRKWTPLTAYAKGQTSHAELRNDKLSNSLQKVGLSKFSFQKLDFEKNENFSEPTAYDILACLTKHEVGSFEEFCSDYGYDTDSMKAHGVYKAVSEEWQNVQIIWNDEEIEQLQEIQ